MSVHAESSSLLQRQRDIRGEAAVKTTVGLPPKNIGPKAGTNSVSGGCAAPSPTGIAGGLASTFRSNEADAPSVTTSPSFKGAGQPRCQRELRPIPAQSLGRGARPTTAEQRTRPAFWPEAYLLQRAERRLTQVRQRGWTCRNRSKEDNIYYRANCGDPGALQHLKLFPAPPRPSMMTAILSSTQAVSTGATAPSLRKNGCLPLRSTTTSKVNLPDILTLSRMSK